ncbi:hypothetical protein CS022_21200 [Veronia nyctiphanis]|uniref:Uncharacterized protein n=1 Tax=Veronia nyctiphanis TaxID=1278244 RepID=A0A4Q0YKR2_9GAMM|nr:hypothetical protein [Veronia nyctiphanis]RXJ71347.1 hypothetical protein CS022_21200 [Veronia nyctiphanis]
MKQTVPLNQWLYKALIENEMDGFSVLEIRNDLLEDTAELFDKQALRKIIYRQIYKLVDRGFLEKRQDEAQGSNRYFKTDRFKALHFVSAKRTILPPNNVESQKEPLRSFLGYICEEKAQSEAELRVMLGEADEYKRVLAHFPAQSTFIHPLYEKSKAYSSELLGRINALSKLVADAVKRDPRSQSADNQTIFRNYKGILFESPTNDAASWSSYQPQDFLVLEDLKQRVISHLT